MARQDQESVASSARCYPDTSWQYRFFFDGPLADYACYRFFFDGPLADYA